MCMPLRSETHVIPQIHQEHLHRVESSQGSLTTTMKDVPCGDGEMVILRRFVTMMKGMQGSMGE